MRFTRSPYLASLTLLLTVTVCTASLKVQDSDSPFVSLTPIFKVQQAKTAEFRSTVGRMEEITFAQDANITRYYSFHAHEDQVMSREAFTSADDLLKHIENVGAQLDRLASCSTMAEMLVVGPRVELEPLRKVIDQEGVDTRFYETDGLPRVAQPMGARLSLRERSNGVSMHPVFTIHDRAATLKAIQKVTELASKEEGLVTLDWAIRGDSLVCRELYVDAAAVLQHRANISEVLGAWVESGAATFDQFQIAGPAGELEQLKEVMASSNPTYWNTLEHQVTIL